MLLTNLESSDSDGFRTVSKSDLAQSKVREKASAKLDMVAIYEKYAK